MGNFAGSIGGHFTLRASVYEINIDTPNNRSLVRMDLFIDCDSTGTGVYNLTGSASYGANTNGNGVGGNFNYDFRGNRNTILLRTFDTWCGHDGAGNATIGWSASANMDNAPYVTTAGTSGTLGLTHINRSATITSFNQNVTDSTLEFDWTSSDNVDYISWWSGTYDGGGHHDIPASGTGAFVINLANLRSETTYDITVAVRRADSGVWTQSGTAYPTTSKQNNYFGMRVP